MGRRGLPPKPTALRILQGNPGKIKLNPQEPQPAKAGADQPPPKWLDKTGREAWVRLRPDLLWLTVADLDIFAAYCNAFSRWRQAEENIASHGMIFVIREPARKGQAEEKGAIKYVQQNPHVAIAVKYQTLLRGFAAELGLTPAARTRIHVAPAEGAAEHDPKSFFGT